MPNGLDWTIREIIFILENAYIRSTEEAVRKRIKKIVEEHIPNIQDLLRKERQKYGT
jgi:hypothetical protein